MAVRGADKAPPPRAAGQTAGRPSAVPAPRLAQVASGASLLRLNMQGGSVQELQQLLVKWGALRPEEVTGTFDRATLEGVRAFQKKNGLAVDGLVGPKTLEALKRPSAWAPPAQPLPAVVHPQRAVVIPTTRPPEMPRAEPLPAVVHPQRAVVTPTTRSPIGLPNRPSAVPPQPMARPDTPPMRVSSTGPLADLPGLSPQRRTELDLVLAGQMGSGSKGALQSILGAPGYLALDGPGRTRVLSAVQTSNLRASLADIERLVNGPVFTAASPEQRGKLVDLVEAGQAKVIDSLGQKMFLTDAVGGSLLDSVHALATGPLAPELAGERQAILSSVLNEAQNNQAILQGNRGTCGGTSVAIVTAKLGPAELVRLVAGLASESGSLKTAAGAPLSRVPGSERPDDSGRTPSQRLLQSALMDLANGRARYDPAADKSIGTGEAYVGLHLSEIEHLMTSVLGKPHTTFSTLDQKWIYAMGQTSPTAAITPTVAKNLGYSKSPTDLWANFAKNPENSVVALAWGKAGHAVVGERIENGRVYFTNPQGNRLPLGAAYPADDPPPRRAELGSQQSMSIEDFRASAWGVVMS